MDKYLGMLIRKRRLEKNYSQEGLCRGICVVSYLSKIEQGLVSPGKEIIDALLKALDLIYYDDPEMLNQGLEYFRQYFEHNFFCDNPEEVRNHILENAEKYEYSELHIWYSLFLLQEAAVKEDDYDQLLCQSILGELEHYLSFMDNQQKFIYYQEKGYAETDINQEIKYYQQAKAFQNCSMITFDIASAYSKAGYYSDSIRYCQETYALASDEGNLAYMIRSSVLLGVNYSNYRNLDNMFLAFNRTLNLCRSSYSQTKKDVYYNIGATYTEYEEYEKALPYLLKTLELAENNTDIMLCHKLAVCYISFHKYKEAEKYLSIAEMQLEQEKTHTIYHDIIRLVRLKLDTDYMDNEEYGSLLAYIYNHSAEPLSFGHKVFHGKQLIQYYIYHRCYKDALRITEEITIQF